MDPKQYHVCWPLLTAKRVEPVVSISWASCMYYWAENLPCISDLLAYSVTSIVAAAITASATAYSAISLLYLHIINIPIHVICRATTDDNGQQRTTTDDVVRCRIEVDVRRRAVCERALKLHYLLEWRTYVAPQYAPLHTIIRWLTEAWGWSLQALRTRLSIVQATHLCHGV